MSNQKPVHYLKLTSERVKYGVREDNIGRGVGTLVRL